MLQTRKRYCTIRKIGTVPSNDESIIYFIQSQGLYNCTKMIIRFFATGRVYVVDATRCHVGKYIAMKWCNANYLIFLCRQKGFSDKIIAVDLESGLKKITLTSLVHQWFDIKNKIKFKGAGKKWKKLDPKLKNTFKKIGLFDECIFFQARL